VVHLNIFKTLKGEQMNRKQYEIRVKNYHLQRRIIPQQRIYSEYTTPKKSDVLSGIICFFSVFVMGVMIFMALVTAADWIGERQELSRQIVAETKGDTQ